MPRVKLFDEKEVLIKAMHLFWKQGYAATSVQDLVNSLGINRASLYDTFGDKEKLFKKAFAYYRKINNDALVAFLKKYPNVKEGFTALFNASINEAVSDIDCKGCFVVNSIAELIPGDDHMVRLIQENQEFMEVTFFEYLKKGKENGQLKTTQDLKSLAYLLYTIQAGIKIVSKADVDKEKLLKSVEVGLSLLV
ncbi:TetR/AcrR family transcriptional regulator [uncultured Maribacter sp.]|uniref:TetR/AcrR family transcriptional regulator n=1 Tax=uncultured Maribacter sp. TaxID=431308 RepID=UPI00262A9AD2|nr:TetR/AcrR family transcriptional regulator [uncultured Maribacter sp.]